MTDKHNLHLIDWEKIEAAARGIDTEAKYDPLEPPPRDPPTKRDIVILVAIGIIDLVAIYGVAYWLHK